MSVSWNCRGLGNPSSVRTLKDLGCVCFFHLMLNRTFFELNAE